MTDAPHFDLSVRPSRLDLTLLDLLQRLDQPAGKEAIFEAVEHALVRLARPDCMAIGSLDPATRRLRAVRVYGTSLGLPDQYEAPIGDDRSLFHIPLTQGVSVQHTLRPDRDIYRGDAIRRQHGMQQAMIVPVIARGAVVGVLALNSADSDRFSVETMTAVETVGRILGLALLDHHEVIGSASPSDVASETHARIVMAESVADVRSSLVDGVGRTTGATVLCFDRTDDGAYRYVSGRRGSDPAPEALDPDEAGPSLAGAIATMIDTRVGGDTVPQRVIVTSLPLDADAPARIVPPDALPDQPGLGAAVIAPLHASGELLGALVAVWPESISPQLLPGYARAVLGFSDIAGPTLHRLIRVDRLEQRLAESETMRRLTDSIARTPTLQGALDIICRTSRLITRADFVAIAEITSGHVIWHSASGARSTAFLHQRLPGPVGVLSRLLAHQTAVLIEDARHHPEFTPEAMPVHTAEGLRSTAIIPVYVNARMRAAVMFAWRRPRAVDSSELPTFHALAAGASTALSSSDARMRASDG